MSDTKINIGPTPALGVNDLQRNDIARPVLFAKVKNDVTFDQVMTPAFWRNHVASFIRHPFSQVHVIREDGSMILELVCLSAVPGMAVMHCKYKFVDDANLKTGRSKAEGGDGLVLPAGYAYAHVPNGEGKGHMVRLPSGEVLIRGGKSKAEVVKAAMAHAAVANTPVGTEPAKTPETV